MKITNTRLLSTLKILLRVWLVLSSQFIAYIIVVYPFNLLNLLLGLSLPLIGLVLYIRLRKIELDTTGEVMVVRSYHPNDEKSLRKNHRAVEIPKYMVKSARVHHFMIFKKLEIQIIHDNKRETKVYLDMTQMEKNKLDVFVSSLRMAEPA